MSRRTRPVINQAAGVADILAAAMNADGIDLADPAAIGAWMNAFNNRPTTNEPPYSATTSSAPCP